jgi:hypothetical protein
MATTALVDKNSIDLGRRMIAELSRAGIPVAVGLWAFAPQSEEWQLTIATPLVDELGPLAAYGKVRKVLEKSGVEDHLPLRSIFLRSPKDRVLRSLQKESRALGHEDYRLVNAAIEGNFVEDAYLYTGFIQINQLQRKAHSPIYSVFYAPIEGPGGIVPDRKFQEIDHLHDFLKNDLHVSEGTVESALRNLRERGSATVPNVELKDKDLKRLKLA